MAGVTMVRAKERKRDQYRENLAAQPIIQANGFQDPVGLGEEVIFLLMRVFSIILRRNQVKAEWECHCFLVLRVKAKG